jgi:hypothetical protein
MLTWSGLQPSNRLPFPEAVQSEAEQIVEQVIAGRDLLEQLAHRRGITGLHRC